METHEPNVYPTILGGVSRGFWTPFLNRVARSAIFWHFKTGTFAKSARSNRSPSVVYGSITLKFFWGALGTIPHQWFNRRNEIQKKFFLGHPTRHAPNLWVPSKVQISMHGYCYLRQGEEGDKISGPLPPLTQMGFQQGCENQGFHHDDHPYHFQPLLAKHSAPKLYPTRQLDPIWQGLRCCRKWGKVCQQNSDA